MHVGHSDRGHDEQAYLAAGRDRQALLDYYRLSHDTQKHLATLTAGSIVLIATFLKDIFRTLGQEL
jgi:hypothetical protein